MNEIGTQFESEIIRKENKNERTWRPPSKAKKNVKMCKTSNERMFEEETLSEVKSLLRNIQRPFKETKLC